jgi:uncharacterized protein
VSQEPINWQQLAEQLKALGVYGGGDDSGRRALEVLIGEERIRAAVDYYVAWKPEHEWVSTVLRILHPWSAMQRCYEIFRTSTDQEFRRAALNLLADIADRRALGWITEFLDDEDGDIQNWGMSLLEDLVRGEPEWFEEYDLLLTKAEQHANPYVREYAFEAHLHCFPNVQETPFLRAAAQGNRDRVEELLSRGVDVNEHDEFDQTALHFAAREGHYKIAQVLLTAGATVNAQDKLGQTPLMLAAERRAVDIVELLLAHGAAVNLRDKKDQSALILTLGEDQAVVWEMRREGEDREQALDMAKDWQLAIVNMVLAAQADVDTPDWAGRTALMKAAEAGRITIVNLLLEHWATVNRQDCNGGTALMSALVGGEATIVHALLARGANVNLSSLHGFTPLMSAAFRWETEIVQAFISHGAEVNARTYDGETALHNASREGRTETVRLLLTTGAQVNARGMMHQTPLIDAAQGGHIAVVKVLLAHKAEVNAQDMNGQTALLLATAKRSANVVKVLLEASAIDLPDHHGRTAATVAKGQDNIAVLRLLQQFAVE